MGVIGVAAGPDQIADGTNPNQLASVTSSGDVVTLRKGIDQDGVERIQRVASDGDMQIWSHEVLVAILVELRTMNNILAAIGAGMPTLDDPQAYRDDGDITGITRQLS